MDRRPRPESSQRQQDVSLPTGLPQQCGGARVIDRCPCRGINLPKVEREEFDLLTVEGVNRLIEAADEPERTLFATLAYAGLRLGEGLGLKWKDIDFHKNCIRVERTWGQFGWLVVWRRLVR